MIPSSGTPTYIPLNDTLVALIILNTHMWGFGKNIYPLGGAVLAARVGGLDGEGQGSENFFMLCIPIWIPHEILSILSMHTWGNSKFLSPTICEKKIFPAPLVPNWDQIWTGPC